MATKKTVPVTTQSPTTQVNPTYKMYTLLRSPKGWHCAIYTIDQDDKIVSKQLTEAMTRGGATEELKITLYKNLLHNIDNVEGFDLLEEK